MPELIIIEKNASQERLEELKVFGWPVWEKKVSEFSWNYDRNETCYILEGSAEIVQKGENEGAKIEKGDLVVFKSGLECTWKVIEPVKKHYSFS